MAEFAVWTDGSDSPVTLTRNRTKAFATARSAVTRRHRRVAVYDDAGRVFSPTGESTFCPECNRRDGNHFPGPPHCRRIIDSLA